MKAIFKFILSLVIFLSINVTEAAAQCAMCRATVENNVSNGDTSIGAGLNFGILYLFIMPYLAIGVIGYLWYRKSKQDAKKEQSRRHYFR